MISQTRAHEGLLLEDYWYPRDVGGPTDIHFHSYSYPSSYSYLNAYLYFYSFSFFYSHSYSNAYPYFYSYAVFHSHSYSCPGRS